MSTTARIGGKAPVRPPAYASLEEAASYCRLHPNTLRRAIKAGTLQAHKVGGRVIVEYSAIDAFITGRIDAPPAT